MGHCRRGNEQLDENSQALVHRRLHSWGLWCYWQDNPGLDIDPISVIGKLVRQSGEWASDGVPEDRLTWEADAEAVNAAIMMVSMVGRPILAQALKSAYEFIPELLGIPKADRLEYQRLRLCMRSQRDVSGSTMRSLLAEGRRLVAIQLPWIQKLKERRC